MMDIETRIKALATHLDCDIEEIIEFKGDERMLSVGNGKYPDEYFVLTDDEAEQEWDERLNSFLDECVLHEMPDYLQSYFDIGAWKRDAQIDGRGHTISSYDGCEYDVEVDGETLYIYRMN